MVGALLALPALRHRMLLTLEGEAKRNDAEFAYVAAWAWRGEGARPELRKEPLAFEVKEKKKFWLCACGKTKTPPFCDGSHQKK